MSADEKEAEAVAEDEIQTPNLCQPRQRKRSAELSSHINDKWKPRTHSPQQ